MKGRLLLSFLLLLAVFVLPTEIFGQCKFKKAKKFLEFPKKKGGIIPNANQATKPGTLLGKLNVGAIYSFVQSGEDAYFYVQLGRGYSKKIATRKDCPLSIFNDKGQNIQLFPIGNYRGRFIMTTYVIGIYYKISKEELNFLIGNDTPNVKFTFSKQDSEGQPISLTGDGWSEDSQGRPTYRATIKSSKSRKELRKNAECINTKL